MYVAFATKFGGVMNIFTGIEETDLNALTNCLQAVKKTYMKDEIIFDTGDKITAVAYVLDGLVQLSKDDYDGNKVIIGNISATETFGESMVCAGIKKSLVSAKALENTQILFLDFSRILSICSNNCKFHKQLIENMIKIISFTNINLQDRIELLSKKSLRERILYMLFKEKQKSDKIVFEIPYSREQMAEFICADRSALSRELSNMKAENIIDYQKNIFKII